MEIKKRKHPRLKDFDYSTNGYYFVTICTANHKEILSSVNVGRGLAPAEIILSPAGKIAEEQLLNISKRYACVDIEKYVIMPNHIHILLFIDGFSAGASPRPTLSDIICSFKSLTARNSKPYLKTNKLWQTSFYDHVIRNKEDYLTHYNYIESNPSLWEKEKNKNE
ncbi:MAG: transposase [Clostridia bacterium]|nr:transposase [Clostridia bacterium]